MADGTVQQQKLDEREAAMPRRQPRSGGSAAWTLDGEETITVTTLGVMWRGDEMEQQQSTMGAHELDPTLAGY